MDEVSCHVQNTCETCTNILSLQFGNLQAWSQRTSAAGAGQQRRVVYGSTNLYSARDFIVNELMPLGAEST
jgi:hypothetical protein